MNKKVNHSFLRVVLVAASLGLAIGSYSYGASEDPCGGTGAGSAEDLNTVFGRVLAIADGPVCADGKRALKITVEAAPRPETSNEYTQYVPAKVYQVVVSSSAKGNKSDLKIGDKVGMELIHSTDQPTVAGAHVAAFARTVTKS